MRSLWEITQPYGLRCRAENSIRKRDAACGGSGRARETGDAVNGTGFAGVRGRARSHRDPAKSISYLQFYESCLAGDEASPGKTVIPHGHGPLPNQ